MVVRLELRNAYLLHWTDIHPIRTDEQIRRLFGRHGITETEFERNPYGGCGILFSNNGILLRKRQLRTDRPTYPNANDTRTRNRNRKPVPENLYQFSASVSCESVSIFFWYRNLVRSRTMFYSVQEIVTKMTSTDWSTMPVVLFL